VASGNAAPATIAVGQTVTRTITLGPPSTQPRKEDKVGFFTICAQGANSAAAQGTAQLYAWSAFEEGWPPPVVIPEEDGTIASGSLGSLGGSATDSVDPEPPVDEEPPVDDLPGDEDPLNP